MKDLRPVRGRYYIRELISQGEHEEQDFKFAISDARKIARSVSAFANNRGGRLLVGVKDNGTIAGVRSEEDIFVVEQAARMYCVPPQPIEVTAFKIDPGVVVFRVVIARAERRPVVVREADGSRRAYYRVADENIAVPSFVGKAWRGPSGAACAMSLDGTERSLLDLLIERNGITYDEAVRLLHITGERAEEALARLYSLGLIDFRIGHNPVEIIPAPENL